MTETRIAVLGTARIARTVAPHIHKADGAQLVGIASRDQSRAEAFAQEFNIPRTWGSYEEVIADDNVDAVYIPLPPSMHREWTERAAAAGKHVLCEKPVSANPGDTAAILDCCRANDVVFLDGVMWYHTPRAAEMLQVASSGQLGEIRQVNAVFTFRWDTWPMEDLRMQRSMGGGSLLDLGWYCVGAALMLLDDMPIRVSAWGQYINDVDTRMNAHMWFPGDRMATIECGFDTLRRRWVEVAGTKESLVCDDFTRPWKEDRPRFWIHDSDGVSTEHLCPTKPQEQCMVEEFCRLIRSGETDHPLLQRSLNTQIVCDALDRSARSEQPVEL
ncbi:MAG TPA: oxidoreductase [Planctomycetaceae bacterium]|nr:oxidoreductase [Planctomycetaceae bacterium]